MSHPTAASQAKKDLLLVRNDELFKFHVDDESEESGSVDGDSTGDGSSKDRSQGDPDSRGGGSQSSQSQASSSLQPVSHSTFSIADDNVDVDIGFSSGNAASNSMQHTTSAQRPSIVGGAADFDLHTVIKATQAISSELQLDKLLSTLMKIVLTNSGGEKGLLLSKKAHVNGRSLRRMAKKDSAEEKKRSQSSDAAASGEEDSSGSKSSAAEKKEAPAESVDSSSDSGLDDEDDEREASDEEWVVEVETCISEFRNLQPNANRSDYATATFSSGNNSREQLSPAGEFMWKGVGSRVSSAGSEKSSASQPAMQKASSPNPLSRTLQRGRPGSVVENDRHSYPLSIVNYVINSKRSVILSNASQDRRFSSDPYISSRRVKSVLCTPLIHRNKLVSVLFLENNVSASTFTAERLVVCRLLVQQAAISIDNARLYNALTKTNQTLEARVAQRTKELEEATKLATEANKAKSSFLANMSHEIRTPMVPAISHTSASRSLLSPRSSLSAVSHYFVPSLFATSERRDRRHGAARRLLPLRRPPAADRARLPVPPRGAGRRHLGAVAQGRLLRQRRPRVPPHHPPRGGAAPRGIRCGEHRVISPLVWRSVAAAHHRPQHVGPTWSPSLVR